MNMHSNEVSPGQSYQVEHVSLDDLHAHPRNYQSHPLDELTHIKESIRTHGYYRNIVIAQDGTILAGHGVVEATRQLGLRSVPAIRLNYAPDDPRALQLLIGDNEIRHLAEVDDRALTELLRELKDVDELLGTGYDEETLRQMLDATTPASSDEWTEALSDLPDGDKSPFQQMTFTLSNAQAEMVKEALDLALEDKANFEDMGNQNSNGNALASIVKFFLEMGKVAA